MTRIEIEKVLCLGLMSGLLATGCSKMGSSSKPLEVGQIPSAMNTAFDKSSGDAKQAATETVTAVQANDPVAAFQSLRNLSARPDLTPQQRNATSRAMAATFKQLRDAADAGNANAQAAVHQYISTR